MLIRGFFKIRGWAICVLFDTRTCSTMTSLRSKKSYVLPDWTVRRQKFMVLSRSQDLINFENWKSEADSDTSTIKTRKSVSSVKVRKEAGRRVLVEQKRPMSKKNWARP